MTRLHHRRVRAAGFSLIELLVSMAIGLVVTIAITSVMINSEGSKRSTTSVNDISETGTYLGYVLDRSIRNAGSGYSQNWTDAYGCVLDASYGGSALLPMPTAAPAPFMNVPTQLRLAPVLIGKSMADTGGQTRGDVIITMAGMSGLGETPQTVTPHSVTSNSLVVTNGLGYNTSNNSLAAGNLILLADTSVTGGCLMQQVSSATSNQLNLGGNYYKASGNTGTNITAFGTSTVAIQLGGDPGNAPMFQMFAVGDNNTLWTQDLLKAVDTTATSATMNPVQVADGVVEMHALYGIDSTPALQKVGSWVDPGSTPYRLADLSAGTTAAQTNLHNILAIRVGMILRTSLPERNPIGAATTLTLFKDLPASVQQTYTISGSNLNYRFRTVEFTVPLRNLYF
jgi:type IV pilus assembly protein PilW